VNDLSTGTTDATPTGSSPAPSSLTADAVHESMTHVERESWQKTGDLPERFSTRSTPDAIPTDEKTAESSPAQPVEQAASTDATKPASEAKPGKGQHLKARISEVDAEIERDRQALQERLRTRALIREELARTAQPDATAAASSAERKPEQGGDGTDPSDPKPKDTDFEQFAEYLDARDAWNERRIGRKMAAERQQSEQASTLRSIGERATARVEEYAKIDPEFVSRVDHRIFDVPVASAVHAAGQPVGPQHVLAEEILTSDYTPQLLLHFSTPEGQKDWSRICQAGSRNPAAIAREIGRLESTFTRAPNSAPATKHVSSAPTPPTVLGQRTAESADPLESAIKRKDGLAYERLANERELAGMRSR
jgi:hypothetical protein